LQLLKAAKVEQLHDMMFVVASCRIFLIN